MDQNKYGNPRHTSPGCLKVAVMSFPASDKSWEAEVVDELKRRTNSLMTVLEGAQDDMPF
jgi:hypothetical protein